MKNCASIKKMGPRKGRASGRMRGRRGMRK